MRVTQAHKVQWVREKCDAYYFDLERHIIQIPLERIGYMHNIDYAFKKHFHVESLKNIPLRYNTILYPCLSLHCCKAKAVYPLTRP